MGLYELVAVEPVVDEERVDRELAEYVERANVVRDDDQRWRIENRGAADWALEKLAAVAAIRIDYEQQIERWTSALARLDRARDFFEGHLKSWALATRTDNEKSFPLAHGHIGTKASGPALAVDDNDAVVEWARSEHADLIAVKETVGVNALKSVAEIGELVVAWDAISHETGERQTVELETPVRYSEERRQQVAERMGDGFTVSAMVEQAVFVKGTDERVPGAVVRPGAVTASVRPYLP